MKLIKINKDYSVLCEWKKTRMAFKHEATLLLNGSQVGFAKICYQNRTWESYDFQSVIHKVIDKHFEEKQAKRLKKTVDGEIRKEEEKQFAPVKAICAMGNLLCDTDKEKADWKKRMIGTIPGIDFPENFNQLSDEERNNRLDKVLEVL